MNIEEKLKKVLTQLNKIEYGWVDKYGVVHKKSRKDFFLQNYRLQSIDETLKYKVGTCWEQVELARYLLKKESIQCKTYIIIYNDDDVIAKHTIAIVENKQKYYLIESSWDMELRVFNSTDEIFTMFIKMYPNMYKIKDYDVKKIEIFEYGKPNEHLNYSEFTKFYKQGVKQST